MLHYTIRQHSSTPPMGYASHGRVTDCALCVLPNNYQIQSNYK